MQKMLNIKKTFLFVKLAKTRNIQHWGKRELMKVGAPQSFGKQLQPKKTIRYRLHAQNQAL